MRIGPRFVRTRFVRTRKCLIPRVFFRRLGALRRRRLLRLLEQHEIIRDHVANVEVNNPVHQVEADETHREHDAGIFVDVRRRYAYLRNVRKS